MEASVIDLFSQTAPLYLWHSVVLNTFLAMALGFCISIVYKNTHSGLSYSASFVLLLVMVTMISATAMMIIGNNIARAFALVGALSIIRFRTVIKDTRDIGFIFFALVSGMAAGTSAYFIAVFSTLILSGLVVILYSRNYGSLVKKEFVLRIDSLKSATDSLLSASEPMVDSMKVLELEGSGADSDLVQLTYDVTLKNETDLEDFVRTISSIAGVRNVQLIASQHDVDY